MIDEFSIVIFFVRVSACGLLLTQKATLFILITTKKIVIWLNNQFFQIFREHLDFQIILVCSKNIFAWQRKLKFLRKQLIWYLYCKLGYILSRHWEIAFVGGVTFLSFPGFAFRDFKTSAEFGDSLCARLRNVERSQTKT